MVAGACALTCACAEPKAVPARALPPEVASAPAVPIERLRQPIVVRDVGFEAPESVLHDIDADLYLVSNVVGAAAELDDRAFISRVRPDGTIEELRWIDASQPGVDLSAPKGMAIAGTVLYVVDLDRVRKFDRRTGRALGSFELSGASFLHDIAVEPDGTVYVSDSGLGAGLSPSGSDAIYRVDVRGRSEVFARSPTLGQPSGLWLTPKGLFVASFGSGALTMIARDGTRIDLPRPPKGSLDGLAISGDHLYVSSWEGAAIYEVVDGKTRELLSGMAAPADLSVDQARQRLLVTHYTENSLSIHQL